MNFLPYNLLISNFFHAGLGQNLVLSKLKAFLDAKMSHMIEFVD